MIRNKDMGMIVFFKTNFALSFLHMTTLLRFPKRIRAAVTRAPLFSISVKLILALRKIFGCPSAPRYFPGLSFARLCSALASRGGLQVASQRTTVTPNTLRSARYVSCPVAASGGRTIGQRA